MSPIATKQELWFLNTLVNIRVATDEGHDRTSVIESLARRGDSPPLHIHHTEDEIFHVLGGEFRVRVGDDEVHLGPGGTLLAPRGVAHTYRVESDEGLSLVITPRGDFERFVRRVGAVAPWPSLPAAGDAAPTAAQVRALADAAAEHGIEIVGPPM